ncbi:hypothetical protein [Microcystis aeruginosa]|uniref:hypothetical protein n=1 Tax=Microcystis aeruginosa TaxID=1126 RepID=UPI0013038C8D|nr:hypothetical protein [Microcystis aeruginosa]
MGEFQLGQNPNTPPPQHPNTQNLNLNSQPLTANAPIERSIIIETVTNIYETSCLLIALASIAGKNSLKRVSCSEMTLIPN